MRVFFAVFICLGMAAAAQAESITVSAAISLKEAMTEIGKTYEAKTGERVDFNFGASGLLAAQIRQGAPVDAFISAADKQVNELVKSGHADVKSRRVIARNTIVLIVPAKASNPPRGFADLADKRVKKLAIGQPRAVPAGQYAMQTLAAMKLSQAVASKLIYGANVRQVLEYVRRNEVDAGIVYATDAKQAEDEVKVAATAEASTHDPIEYPAVIVTGSAHADAARKFLDYLGSAPARAVFVAQGFQLPKDQTGTRPSP
jgi:molybdate transport system substrate-binding protein